MSWLIINQCLTSVSPSRYMSGIVFIKKTVFKSPDQSNNSSLERKTPKERLHKVVESHLATRCSHQLLDRKSFLSKPPMKLKIQWALRINNREDYLLTTTIWDLGTEIVLPIVGPVSCEVCYQRKLCYPFLPRRFWSQPNSKWIKSWNWLELVQYVYQLSLKFTEG